MSVQDNEAVARRLIEAHNSHNVALLDNLFAPGYVNHSAPPGQQDAAARREQIRMYLEASPTSAAPSTT